MRHFIAIRISFYFSHPQTLPANMVFKKWLKSSKILTEKWIVESFVPCADISQKVELGGAGKGGAAGLKGGSGNRGALRVG